MRVLALVFSAILLSAPAWGQETRPSSPTDRTSPAEDSEPPDSELNLPVSIAKIKQALAQPARLSLRSLDERPTFRVQVLERQKIEELIASMNFKSGPVPAGGVYMQEQQRVMFPAVDNPLVQPYAAFNQGELLTILIENLVRGYLGGKVTNAISKAERAHAEAAAKEEVRAAVEQYCNAQPNAGSGIQICSNVGR